MDNDNDPAPENVPQPNEVQEYHNLKVRKAWGFDGIDQQAITGVLDQLQNSKMIGIQRKKAC